MSFWDDLQKTLSEATDFTVQKTTELGDLAKLKYNIHSSEKKLERIYAEMGKIWFDIRKNGVDRESEAATLVMQAEKLAGDIAGMKAEAAKLKKTNVCPVCSAEVSKECTFCPVCGEKLCDDADDVDDADEADEDID